MSFEYIRSRTNLSNLMWWVRYGSAEWAKHQHKNIAENVEIKQSEEFTSEKGCSSSEK